MDALEKASAYISMRPHSEKEVSDYLLRKGYEPDEVSRALTQLKEYNYIDDIAFAKLYFEYGFEKGRGEGRIRRELAEKGVCRSDIDCAWDELEEKPDEDEMAMKIARQVVMESGLDLGEMSYEERQKLQAKIVRRLASRGFRGSTCYSAAREAVKDNF